jgi:hypothetical protein
MLLNLLDKAAPKQGLIKHVDYVRATINQKEKISGTSISLCLSMMSCPAGVAKIHSFTSDHRLRWADAQSGIPSGTSRNRPPSRIECGLPLSLHPRADREQ